jgi:predicted nuclease of predicted toxin-antitoxin system
MDVHVRRAITVGLKLRGVDVLTAQADGAARLSDPQLLDRASELNRVLFSQDHDLLREATARQRRGEFFAGVIYAHQLRVTIGQCIDDLELIAKGCEPEDFVNCLEFLPLK